MIDRPEVRTAPDDPDRMPADLARQGAVLHPRAGGLLRACTESSGADTHMRELDELGARMMAQNMRTVAEALDRHALLAVGVDEAADVLFTLNSPHVHDLLVRRALRGLGTGDAPARGSSGLRLVRGKHD